MLIAISAPARSISATAMSISRTWVAAPIVVVGGLLPIHRRHGLRLGLGLRGGLGVDLSGLGHWRRLLLDRGRLLDRELFLDRGRALSPGVLLDRGGLLGLDRRLGLTL